LKMQVLATTEERFSRTPDGAIWTTGPSAYSFWQRYLDGFDRVRVLARVHHLAERPHASKRVDGDAIAVEALPSYIGPRQYALKYFSIGRAVREALSACDAVILRVASPIANRVRREMAKDQPFGVEVVGDPHEVFAPGAVEHPLRPLLRWTMTRQLKRQCHEASAVAYVYGGTLQERYPASRSAFVTTYSSVELCDDAYVLEPRKFLASSRPARMISVGTLEVPYKGFDVLIDAVALCEKTGADVELVMIGDGRLRASLEEHARRRGVGRKVRFAGRVPAGADVRAELDRADLFALASKTEGLPRAMIEAMARALPCVGTAVGGIPVLIGRDELVSRGDAGALASKICAVLADPERMTRLSAANLEISRQYHDSILATRRRQFLTHVASLDWSNARLQAKIPHASRERTHAVRAD
jgi:glycosyltransferase involved in cell wall biosynthesis